MRTLVDIPDDQIAQLDILAERENKSRAAEIREAVQEYLERKSSNDWIRRGAGYWKGRDDIGEAVDYQRSMREDRTSHAER